MPKIVEFLGFDPLPEPIGLMERLQRVRVLHGWSIPTAATELGVHPDTLRSWLCREHEPSEENLSLIESFLALHSPIAARPVPATVLQPA